MQLKTRKFQIFMAVVLIYYSGSSDIFAHINIVKVQNCSGVSTTYLPM